VFFRCFSARAGRLVRRRGDMRKTHKNTVFFTGFSHVRACAHDAKIVPNALLDRVARRIVFESRFFELRSLKIVPRGLSGPSAGALERLLGGFWALLGPLEEVLGCSWGALETLLGALGRHLERSWGALGRFLKFLDDLDSILDTPRVDFGASGCGF